MKTVIDSSIEIVDQMIDFIEEISDRSYNTVSKPLFNSSIGEHLRHIVDFYQALISSETQENLVDYDVRRRGAKIEHCRQQGLIELRDVRRWMMSLDAASCDKAVTVKTEVSIVQQSCATFESSFKRELSVASTHLTHHLALMAVIAKTFDASINSNIGLAPATASYLREQAS